MKKLVIKLSILLAFCFAISDVNAQDLYLIIGQSNAAGRDLNIDPNDKDKITSDVKYLKNDDRFIKARQPLNKYSNIRKGLNLQGVNFGLEFGKKMHQYNGNEVYLVVNARGGTKIEQWRKDSSFGYFSSSVQRVKDAQEVCGCSLKGILWHQGESDVKSDSTYTSTYFDSLKGLVAEFRAEFTDVPFIVGQLYQNDKNSKFNIDLKKVDDSDFGVDNVDWATSKNLTTLDDTHFDAASTRKLGVKYAKVMKDYVSGLNRISSETGELSHDNEIDIKVFPNPAGETIQISSINEQETIQIFNLLGSKVIETTSKNIDISALNSGTYYVVVGNNKGIEFIKE